MAISLESLRRGAVIKPPIIGIYGTHGVGKTTLACNAPAPVILQYEDGLGVLDTATFGLLHTYDEGMQAIAALYNETHDFKTVIVDSLDHLEPALWAEVCTRFGWKSIDDGSKETSYGKGYMATGGVWREFLDGMKALRDERGMNIIMLAHAEIKKFEGPESEAYDRYQPKLHKIASALVQETVHCMWFNHRLVSTVKSDPKDAKSKARGVGGGQRVIYTEERPAYLAKNRYSMPHQVLIPDDPAAGWAALAAHLPIATQTTTQEAA